MKLKPKNWESFQHYKDRSPPWIKLHKSILDDRHFQRLPDASRALAPCLWLLASESKDGVFDGSFEELAFRVRQTEKWVEAALKPLISNKFFIMVQDASTALADCTQVAVPETEESREETEEDCGAFDAFWDAYPKKSAKPAARKAFKAAKINGHLSEVIGDIESRLLSEAWLKNGGQFIPNPATYLNQRRWEDETTIQGASMFAGAI